MMKSAAPQWAAATRSGAHPRQMLLLLLACGALLYARSLWSNFVYDDIIQIVKNPRITEWSYLPSYFTEQLWAGIQSASYYRPLLLVWMRLNHFLFGLNPVGWHASSVLLHLGATALAFALAKRILQDANAALVAAAIFLLHPLQVESVAWPSAANESLAAIFIFASYVFFLKSNESEAASRNLVLSWLMFALALLTKETAIIAPLMILVFAWCYLPKDGKAPRWIAALAAEAPYAIIAGLYLVVRKLVLAHVSPTELRTDIPTALTTMPSVAWLYLQHMFAPLRLAVVYDTPYVASLSSPRFWAPLLALISLLVAGVWAWKKRRANAVAIGVIWIPVHLAIPLLTLPLFRNVDLSHDRYLYVPLFGFALLAGYAWQRIPRPAFPKALFAAALIAYAASTFHQQKFWSNDAALFACAQQVSPGAYLSKVLDGQELARQKKYAEAVPLLEASVQQQPRALAGMMVLAYTRCEMGERQAAEDMFARALALQPQAAETNYMLGLCRLVEADPTSAVPPLQLAVEHFPASMEYRLTLGRALVQAGRKQEAIEQYRVAEALAPQSERPALRDYIHRLSTGN